MKYNMPSLLHQKNQIYVQLLNLHDYLTTNNLKNNIIFLMFTIDNKLHT